MKLNADIIFDNLSQSITTESYGHKKKELTLKRPELYNGAGREFKSNQIYISHVDRLPLDPVFGNSVVIISVGGNPPITYLVGKCVCFLIKDTTDLFTIFNLVQQIFDKYDEWDTGLQNILNTTANIKEMVELSFPIFENPILVIDSNFHYLAYSKIIDSQDELATYRPDQNGSIGLNGLDEYLKNYGLNMSMVEPFLMTLRDILYFSINLFEKNIYAGNLTIPFVLHKERQSDIALAQYFAKIIESSFKKYTTILSSHENILKNILQDLLNCFPVDTRRLQYLQEGNLNGKYICLKMKLKSRSQKVPVEYLCTLIESSFSGYVAFEYESSIVTFIDVNKISCEEDTLSDMLIKFLQEMNLIAGVSHEFSNLSMARLYYRQACVAIEIGSSIDPNLSYYPFHDYVLLYMISHCMGEFPLELLLTQGICQLLEHDLDSQANYIITLRTYLNNNMNITKTAEELFVHRSTLMERIKRIEALLQTNLDNPDERLRLQILLKIIETNEKLITKLNNIELLNYSNNNSDDIKRIQELESIFKEVR